MAAERCANYEINAQMCPCTEKSCPNWAICCLCVANHMGNKTWPYTACMRGTRRPQETLTLAGSLEACINRERNLERCPCTYDPCQRRGVCCECIRNHWSADGTDRTACFRG